MSDKKNKQQNNCDANERFNAQEAEDVKADGEIDIEDVVEDDSSSADVTVDEADAMVAKIEDLTGQIEKAKNDNLLIRAEFETYRRRTIKEREELIKNAAEKVLRGLLPIVDDFERGLRATENVADAASVRQGMELIYNKLQKYLESNGVTPIDSDGKEFDADLHEAIASIPAPTPELKGKVVDTTTRGYMINDKVLRHAQVAVGE